MLKKTILIIIAFLMMLTVTGFAHAVTDAEKAAAQSRSYLGNPSKPITDQGSTYTRWNSPVDGVNDMMNENILNKGVGLMISGLAAKAQLAVQIGFKIFMFLFLINFTYRFSAGLFAGINLTHAIRMIITELIYAGMWGIALYNIFSWAPTIIGIFVSFGFALSPYDFGLSINHSNPLNFMMVFGPSNIMDQGLYIMKECMEIPMSIMDAELAKLSQSSETGISAFFTNSIEIVRIGLTTLQNMSISIFVGMLAFLGMVFVAIYLMTLYVEIIMGLILSAVMMGFGGLNFTRKYGMNVFNFVITSGMRLMVFIVVLGASLYFQQGILRLVGNTGLFHFFDKLSLFLLAGLFAPYLVSRVDNMVAVLSEGSFKSGFTDVVSSVTKGWQSGTVNSMANMGVNAVSTPYSYASNVISRTIGPEPLVAMGAAAGSAMNYFKGEPGKQSPDNGNPPAPQGGGMSSGSGSVQSAPEQDRSIPLMPIPGNVMGQQASTNPGTSAAMPSSSSKTTSNERVMSLESKREDNNRSIPEMPVVDNNPFTTSHSVWGQKKQMGEDLGHTVYRGLTDAPASVINSIKDGYKSTRNTAQEENPTIPPVQPTTQKPMEANNKSPLN